jgi:hypothetical protein
MPFYYLIYLSLRTQVDSSIDIRNSNDSRAPLKAFLRTTNHEATLSPSTGVS